MSKQLLKSTASVGSMTLISRLLGFARDMLIARLFGVDIATDAFFAAFKLPNFLRRLFAEGAFAHAFVPVLTDYKENHDPQTLKDFIAKTAGTLALILTAITALGILAAPLLITLLAPGFAWHSAQHELAVELLRITLPYLFFISLTAFLGSILNVYGKFALPALTPVWLNIAMIAAAIELSPLLDEPITALAWGVFAGGIVQLAFQLPAVLRLGLLPKLRPGFSDPGVKKVIGLMLPAMFSVSVTQINLLFDTLIASFLAAGSVSWLYYSDRLVEFPLGILGVAVSTAILPNLSKTHAARDSGAFSAALDWGLRLVLLIGLPASIGLILLAEPILFTLFQYNEFSVSDVHYTGLSLKAYSAGLLGFILIKVLAPAFSSRLDVKTPLRYSIYAMIASIALNVLAIPLAHAGLALATSLGAFFNAILLFRKLRTDQIYLPATGWRLFLLRILLGTGVMSAVLYSQVEPNDWIARSSGERALHLVGWIAAGLSLYAATLWLTGMRLPMSLRKARTLRSTR
ncbi:murein biosynthesis integral membrane protein MurJ [Methylomicrobium lacus]|uniref:murein biosynthesis integral membrane protein MurJ n=1 Tax=Methylomicrobium lacus TaxID=136992 RepID=UPI00045E63CE|nr:murein biosynthesis integral membrane protein MurJ [Methylomicrobium lacus]